MRKKLLAKNTVASLLSQFTALVCGFILPRLFLEYFGSELNYLNGDLGLSREPSKIIDATTGTVIRA